MNKRELLGIYPTLLLLIAIVAVLGLSGCAGTQVQNKESLLLAAGFQKSAIGTPKAFAIHQYPVEKRCPVSCHIKSALSHVLDDTQQAIEQRLRQISLAQLIAELQ